MGDGSHVLCKATRHSTARICHTCMVLPAAAGRGGVVTLLPVGCSMLCALLLLLLCLSLGHDLAEKKKKWANDSKGYTLVEPRHIRVPFLYRHYAHAADWPAPHFTLICRGSWLGQSIPCCVILCPKLYPAAPDLYPDQTGNRRK